MHRHLYVALAIEQSCTRYLSLQQVRFDGLNSHEQFATTASGVAALLQYALHRRERVN